VGRVQAGGYVLLELKSDLPKGFIDIQQILSRIKDYDTELWEEHYYREPDQRGRWRYTRLELKIWVNKEDYQPLANRLGKLPELNFTLKLIAPF